jgi:hypothetical protein
MTERVIDTSLEQRNIYIATELSELVCTTVCFVH